MTEQITINDTPIEAARVERFKQHYLQQRSTGGQLATIAKNLAISSKELRLLCAHYNYELPYNARQKQALRVFEHIKATGCPSIEQALKEIKTVPLTAANVAKYFSAMDLDFSPYVYLNRTFGDWIGLGGFIYNDDKNHKKKYRMKCTRCGAMSFLPIHDFEPKGSQQRHNCQHCNSKVGNNSTGTAVLCEETQVVFPSIHSTERELHGAVSEHLILQHFNRYPTFEAPDGRTYRRLNTPLKVPTAFQQAFDDIELPTSGWLQNTPLKDFQSEVLRSIA